MRLRVWVAIVPGAGQVGEKLTADIQRCIHLTRKSFVEEDEF